MDELITMRDALIMILIISASVTVGVGSTLEWRHKKKEGLLVLAASGALVVAFFATLTTFPEVSDEFLVFLVVASATTGYTIRGFVDRYEKRLAEEAGEEQEELEEAPDPVANPFPH